MNFEFQSISSGKMRLGRPVLCAALFAALLPGVALKGATLGTSFPLYVSDINKNAIVKIDSSGVQSVFTSGGNLLAPFGMAFDGAGNLYVASLGNNSIVKVDGSGIQTIFTSGGSLSGPTGLAFDGSGNLYVANQNNNNIVKVVGGEQTVFTTGGFLVGSFGLAFDASGNLYATSGNGFVVKMDAVGNQSLFAGVGNGLLGLAFDSSGNLYVAAHTSGSNEVVKVDPTGKSVSPFAFSGTLNSPAHLAFDGLGNLFVADSGSKSVTRIDPTSTQAVFTSNGNFSEPIGMAFSPTSNQATIAYSGSATGGEVNNWRTNTFVKAMDIDGDNIYGTWGAVNWTHPLPGSNISYRETETWFFDGSGSQNGNDNYAVINQTPFGPANTTAGTAQNSFTFTLSGPVDAYTGKILRVGVMEDVLAPSDWPFDTFKGLQLKQVNGGGDSGVIPLRGGGPGDGIPEMYFFDILGAKSGDTYTIFAPNNVGGASGNPGYVSAVSFDVAVIATAQVFPLSLNFGNQQQATTSGVQKVTLTNAGSGPLAISSISASGNFAETNNCGASLASAASCQISVTFTPQSTGALTGALTITDSSGSVGSATQSATQTIALSGTGLGIPVLIVAPANLDFGSQQTNTTSSVKTVTLTNSSAAGSAPLSITSITVTGSFAQTNNCPATLGLNASCQISVTFTPQLASSLAGAITIKDNASGAPQTVSLAGVGTGSPVGSLSPTGLTFAGQQQGTVSTAQSVTLSNTGSSALLITSIAVTGPFAQTNNCSASLAPAASCVVKVTFNPQSAGSFTGSLNITDNHNLAPGTVQSVSLSGTGLGNPFVVFSPTSITFPTVLLGQVNSKTLTMTNTGTGPLNIKAVLPGDPGGYSQTNNCGTTLAAGASCQIIVTCNELALSDPSFLRVSDNAQNGFQDLSLSATALYESVTPRSLNFGAQLVGVASASQVITVANSSYGQLDVFSITVPAGFTQTNNCTPSLKVKAVCQINVVFKPGAAVSYSGNLTINAGYGHVIGAPQFPQITITETVALAGTGLQPPKLSGTTLLFVAGPNQATTQSVTLTNNNPTALSFTSITIGGNNPGRFTQTNNCGSSLAPGAGCTVTITYHAPSTAFSSASAVLNITDNAGVQKVALAGVTL